MPSQRIRCTKDEARLASIRAGHSSGPRAVHHDMARQGEIGEAFRQEQATCSSGSEGSQMLVVVPFEPQASSNNEPQPAPAGQVQPMGTTLGSKIGKLEMELNGYTSTRRGLLPRLEDLESRTWPGQPRAAGLEIKKRITNLEEYWGGM